MSNDQNDQRSPEHSWYYLEDGETRGPLAAAQLKRLFQSGQLGPDTLVWRQGMRDWQPARALGVTAQPRSPASVLPPPASALQPSSSRLPPDSTRRLQFLIVGALAGVVILLGGVGIGLALRSPAVSTTGEPRPGAQPSDRTQNRRPPAVPVRTTPTTDGSVGQKPEDAVQPVSPAIESGGKTLPDVGSEPKEMVGDVDPDGKALPTTPDSAVQPSMAPGKEEAAQDAVTTLYQVIDIHRRPAWGIAGMMVTQEMRYQILTRLALMSRQADGTRKVTQKVEQVRLLQADEMSRATYESALNYLVGQQYSFTLNERDEITEFKGFRQETTNLPVSPPGQQGWLSVTVIDEDGWRELTQLSFQRPREGIATGQSWNRPMIHNWSPWGFWRGITTFTQRGPEGYGIRYDYVHEMSYLPPEPTAGVLPFQLAGAQFQPVVASGSYVFDAQHGHVVWVREVFHVQGTIAAGVLGSEARVQVEEYQELAVQISSENPGLPGR